MTLEFAPRPTPTAVPETSATAPLAVGLARLAAAIDGQVVLPGTDDYEAARHIHNLVFDHHPVAVVRPTSAHDVARAVTFARAQGLPIAIRSGGHSVAGHSTTNGLV